MSTKQVFEVIDAARKARLKEDKIKILRENESWALKDILRGTYDDTIQWLIPNGKPPFTPAEGHNSPSSLLRQNKQFTYFVKGGQGEKMMKAKREKIYIALLESIHPKDADLVISMISKQKIPYVTKNMVSEAFPGLIKE